MGIKKAPDIIEVSKTEAFSAALYPAGASKQPSPNTHMDPWAAGRFMHWVDRKVVISGCYPQVVCAQMRGLGKKNIFWSENTKIPIAGVPEKN